MRKKKNLLSRMEQCDSCWIKEPTLHRGKWKELMPEATAVFLELGCGKGRFTCETAMNHPDALFIAVERVPDAMIIGMERALQLGLKNVFFVDADVEKLNEYFMPEEVDRIYINFCDPWPGQKHAKRRLTHEGFLKRYYAVLNQKGQIHFKTDNKDLFVFSLFQFPKVNFALNEVTYHLHEKGIQGVMTDYEEKFHEQGMPIHRCVATKTV